MTRRGDVGTVARPMRSVWPWLVVLALSLCIEFYTYSLYSVLGTILLCGIMIPGSCIQTRAVVLLPVQTSWLPFGAVQNCPQLNCINAHALLMASDVNNYCHTQRTHRSCGSQSASGGKLSYAEIDARNIIELICSTEIRWHNCFHFHYYHLFMFSSKNTFLWRYMVNYKTLVLIIKHFNIAIFILK